MVAGMQLFTGHDFVHNLGGDGHVASGADFVVQVDQDGAGFFVFPDSAVGVEQGLVNVVFEGNALVFELFALGDGFLEFVVYGGALFVDFVLFGLDAFTVFFEAHACVFDVFHDGKDALFFDANLFLDHFDFVQKGLVFFVFLYREELLVVFADLVLKLINFAFASPLFKGKIAASLFAFF